MRTARSPLTTSHHTDDPELAAEVRTSVGDYPLWVGWQIIDEVGDRIRRIMDPGVAYIITDEGVLSAGEAGAELARKVRNSRAPVRHPRWRAEQDARDGAAHLHVARGAQGRARPPDPGGRWRSRRRPSRIRRGDVPARPGRSRKYRRACWR